MSALQLARRVAVRAAGARAFHTSQVRADFGWSDKQSNAA
jgi:hypothetical protein